MLAMPTTVLSIGAKGEDQARVRRSARLGAAAETHHLWECAHANRYDSDGLRFRSSLVLAGFGGCRTLCRAVRGSRHHAGRRRGGQADPSRSEEHTSELQSRLHLVCRLLLEKKKTTNLVRVTD